MKTKLYILSLAYGVCLGSAFGQSIDITATGVGIGTTAPAASLHVKQPGAAFAPEFNLARFDIYGGRNIRILGPLTDDVSEPFTFQTGNSIQFRVDATNAFLITSTGNTVTEGSATVGSLIVGSSLILNTGSYESPEKAIPGTYNTVTVEHGLGGRPRFATVALQCKTAEHGWAVGDQILLSSISMISNNHGVTTAMNSTQIKLIQYGNIYVHSFDTGAPSAITAANWRLVFKAWR